MASTGARGGTRERVAIYDNAKFLLMVLVVAGHLLQMGFLHGSRPARALYSFIYSFHMPLFIFLSGLFVRRETLNRQRVMQRSGWLLFLCLLTKLVGSAARIAVGHDANFSLVNYGDISWFMLTLAAYTWLVYLLREAPALPVGCVGLVCGLAAGYVPWIGTVLSLSRIVVFFPFFWLGCVVDHRRLSEVLQRRPVRVVCTVAVCAIVLLCFARTKRWYRLFELFKGKTCYKAVTQIKHCSWMHRLLAYAISTVVGAAALGATPRAHRDTMTLWGQRTLQVYLLHQSILYVLWNGTGLVSACAQASWGWLVPLPLAAGLTVALSVVDAGALLAPLKQRVYRALELRH